MQKGFTKSLFFKHFWGFGALESGGGGGGRGGGCKKEQEILEGGRGGGKRHKNEVSRSWSFVSDRRLVFYDGGG
jgi:hypothetical protein